MFKHWQFNLTRHSRRVSIHRIFFAITTSLFIILPLYRTSPANERPNPQRIVVSAVVPVFEGVNATLDAVENVKIEVEVDRQGNVILARPLYGHPALQLLSERAARRWQFAPTNESENISKVELEFVFRIMPKGTSIEELTPIFMPPYKVEVRHLPFPKRCC